MTIKTFLEKFDLFASAPSAVARIRGLVLELAVRGNLTPRRSSEGSSIDLLQKIQEEFRVDRTKWHRSIAVEEYPFVIPNSWSWTRLGNIAVKSDAGWSPQCDSSPREGTDWGVLKVSAVSWGKYLPNENKALPFGVEPREEFEVRDGDFLLSRANTEELVARSVVVKTSPPHLMMSDKIVRFSFPSTIDPEFINLVNLSNFAREYYAKSASGTSSSMKNVSRETMCNLPVPLPPSSEQRRIVAKAAELFVHLDLLESKLDKSRALSDALLAAAISELIQHGGN